MIEFYPERPPVFKVWPHYSEVVGMALDAGYETYRKELYRSLGTGADFALKYESACCTGLAATTGVMMAYL